MKTGAAGTTRQYDEAAELSPPFISARRRRPPPTLKAGAGQPLSGRRQLTPGDDDRSRALAAAELNSRPRKSRSAAPEASRVMNRALTSKRTSPPTGDHETTGAAGAPSGALGTSYAAPSSVDDDNGEHFARPSATELLGAKNDRPCRRRRAIIGTAPSAPPVSGYQALLALPPSPSALGTCRRCRR